MALVFYRSAEAPVVCAVALSKALKNHPDLQVRMGVHSGSVSAVVDVTGRANIAGAGINIAQRVMSCGDGGHILLSKNAADDLAEYEHWRPLLHDLGSCEVKHGLTIQVVNLWCDEVGNSQTPSKLRAQKERNRRRQWALLGGAAALLLIIGSFLFWRSGHKPAPSTQRSVAVLPFENLSDEKENAFFADGIQDDILTSLAKVSDLKVISRTSVMEYRGRAAARNLRQIAKALGVENVLEGSVRRSGNRVIVNAQLIDARNDRHIWAERYDRTIADSMSIQGELATEIAGALRAKLEPEEKARLETRPTKNSDAYVFYLKAREREGKGNWTTENQIAVEKLYAQAIALDPEFALAYAQASLSNSYIYEATREEATRIKARTQAEEAVRLAPNLGDSHQALGLSLYWGEKDYGAALKEFALAAAASPNESGSAFLHRRHLPPAGALA